MNRKIVLKLMIFSIFFTQLCKVSIVFADVGEISNSETVINETDMSNYSNILDNSIVQISGNSYQENNSLEQSETFSTLLSEETHDKWSNEIEKNDVTIVSEDSMPNDNLDVLSSEFITEDTSNESSQEGTTETEISMTYEAIEIDPYFPIEPSEDDLKGDIVKPGEIQLEKERIFNRNSIINKEIINNVRNGNFKRASIKKDWRTYSMFPYKSLDGGTQNKPHGIVIHETANPTSTIEGEISYMDRNWRNAFVHAFVDQNNIIEIHDPSYGAWGAGRIANQYFLHIELVEHIGDRTAFMKSILNDAHYAASKLYQFGLIPSRPSKKTGDISGTIWSHHDVSSYLGGTNHTDPTGYFSKFGYSMDEFYELVQYEYSELDKTPPIVSSAKVIEIDNIHEEFTVEIRASSNIGIKQVRIPVWTKKDQSDIRWYEASLTSAGTYIATIKSSEFKFSRGPYHIHSYVYDLNNQQSIVGVKSVSFKGISPKISDAQIENLNNSKGSFDVTFLTTSKYGIKKAEVPVWTKKDQSDLKWYSAKLQGDGRYKVTVESKDFNFSRGPYNIHIYSTSNRDEIGLIGLTQVNFSKIDLQGSLKIDNVLNGFQEYKVTFNTNMPQEIDKIEIPIWGNQNGQNDLKWYEAIFNPIQNNWEVKLKISNHKEFGAYSLHAYATLKTGERILIANSNFSIPIPKISTVVNEIKGEVGQTNLEVVIDSDIPIKEISVPVWQDVNQQDIYWYTARKNDNGKYIITIDYRNHKFRTGKFNTHIYVRLDNGLTFIKGVEDVKIKEPKLSPKVEFTKKKSNKYLVSIDLGGNPEVTAVELPTWSSAFGQDDLKWYKAKYNAESRKWETIIELDNHKNTGKYLSHLYISRENKKKEIFDVSGLYIEPIKVTKSVEVLENLGRIKITIYTKEKVEISIPVWSKKDQSDLYLYKAKELGDNKFEFIIDYANHNYNVGAYTAHLYITDSAKFKTIIGVDGLELARPKLKTNIRFTDIKGNQEKFKIAVDTKNHPEVIDVKFPTWGNARGQNDLVWYKGTYSEETNQWETTVDIKTHKESGKYSTHVYIYFVDGTHQILNTIGFMINPVKIVQNVDSNQAHLGKVQVNLNVKTESDISNIRVPVWSKNDQSDIKWYDAKETNNGYNVLIDYKNHNYNVGNYNMHIYVYTTNGIVTIVGGDRISLSNPMLSDSTEKGIFLR